MPCYNHSKYLDKSIESVLGQSYNDLELIIVDDKSSDLSINIIEKYANIDDRIKIIHHDINMGVSKSRNDAIAASKGEYIAFCDADDIWEKNKIDIQLKYISEKNGHDVVYCDSIIINEDGVTTGDRFSQLHNIRNRNENIFYELCLTNFINTPTVLFDRKCINEKLYFEEDIRYMEDWIYWIKLARERKFLYIDIPLARYRVHTGSTNIDFTGYNSHRIKCYKKIVDTYYDLPSVIKSELYYRIGRNYIDLMDNYNARKYFMQSIRENWFNYKNILQLILLLSKHGKHVAAV